VTTREPYPYGQFPQLRRIPLPGLELWCLTAPFQMQQTPQFYYHKVEISSGKVVPDGQAITEPDDIYTFAINLVLRLFCTFVGLYPLMKKRKINIIK